MKRPMRILFRNGREIKHQWVEMAPKVKKVEPPAIQCRFSITEDHRCENMTKNPNGYCFLHQPSLRKRDKPLEIKGNFDELEINEWYHGTNVPPETILTDGLFMGEADGVTGYGVYVTNDLAIAEKYGKYVYKVKQFDTDYKRDSCFDEPVIVLKSNVEPNQVELYENNSKEE
jgi:hypothetical protein